MNEEEVLKTINNVLLHAETQLLDYEALAIQGLLNLYNKEKEKNKQLEKLDKSNSQIIANMCTRHFNDRKKIRKYESLVDKIKAKIEELDDGIKRDMINYDKVKDESWKLAIHRSMAQKIEIKKVLQSLLEKE